MHRVRPSQILETRPNDTITRNIRKRGKKVRNKSFLGLTGFSHPLPTIKIMVSEALGQKAAKGSLLLGSLRPFRSSRRLQQRALGCADSGRLRRRGQLRLSEQPLVIFDLPLLAEERYKGFMLSSWRKERSECRGRVGQTRDSVMPRACAEGDVERGVGLQAAEALDQAPPVLPTL